MVRREIPTAPQGCVVADAEVGTRCERGVTSCTQKGTFPRGTFVGKVTFQPMRSPSSRRREPDFGSTKLTPRALPSSRWEIPAHWAEKPESSAGLVKA